MSEETLLKEKLNRIGQIIKCLGATKFHSKISISKCEERSLELNGQIKWKPVKMETSYQKKKKVVIREAIAVGNFFRRI